MDEIQQKPEKTTSKVLWIILGAVIGAIVALGFDYFVKPHIQAKPRIEFKVSSNQSGHAEFLIKNAGDTFAEDVQITIWASAPFSTRTDVVKVEHTGGATDASASDYGIYEARMVGDSGRPNAINTISRAVVIRFERVNHGEVWHGRLEYVGPEAVFGLLAHIKGKGISENLYAKFDEIK